MNARKLAALVAAATTIALAAGAALAGATSTQGTRASAGTLTVYSGREQEVVEDLFDCDTCLPESMRDKCEADREAAEARDRAQFLTLCERWNWTECPVILEGDKP